MTDAQKIRAFIRKRAAKDKRRKVPAIQAKTKLFGNVLDSFGVLELIAFVEETFDIPLKRSEVKPANFDTLEKITAFVAARKKRARRKRV